VDRTPYFIPNSTERICSTLAPREASSSISSNEILVELPGVRADVRVRGVDAVHVRVDLANVRFQGRRNGHALVSEPPRPSVVIDPLSSIPLEAGDHRDVSLLQGLRDRLAADLADARLHVRGVGQHGNLESAERSRLASHFRQGDRQQPDRHLFPGGGDDVEFPLVGQLRELVRQPSSRSSPRTSRRRPRPRRSPAPSSAPPSWPRSGSFRWCRPRYRRTSGQ